MRKSSLLAFAALVALLAPTASAQGPWFQPPPPGILGPFQSYDKNDDGQIEIDYATELFQSGESGPRALLLIEPRLVNTTLLPRLIRMATDLGNEGYRAVIVELALAPSEVHQDGRFVLAMREVLRAYAADGELAGATLIGRFPDAFLVRVCNWRRKGDITLHKGEDDQVTHRDVRYLRRVPEDIAHRADIVLADLDGRWEHQYVQPKSPVVSTLAVFDGDEVVDMEFRSNEFEDFFFINDGLCKLDDPDAMEFTLIDERGNVECAMVDAERPNVIARPEISISRIDAKGTALALRSDVTGTSGEGLLDQAGLPQAVTFADQDAVPNWKSGIWAADEALEVRLLAEYFDRNHAFRTGQTASAWRPASIACELGSGYDQMAKAADDWDLLDQGELDITGKPSLDRFAEWMRFPAILKTVRAHSNSTISAFGKPDAEALLTAAGGTAWSWTQRGNRLVPSLDAACSKGNLGWFLLHAMWRNKVVAAAPTFYHHGGCHGISPPSAKTRAYDDARYGQRQGAEALLFFGEGLALIGRSKVFYDEPKGFAEALRNGATFGSAWAQYFEIESMAPTWAKAGGDIGRKRSYFWSVLGDWSLRLSMGR